MDLIFSYDKEALSYIIQRGCEIKGHVVENDEKESNLRKILNFGREAKITHPSRILDKVKVIPLVFAFSFSRV